MNDLIVLENVAKAYIVHRSLESGKLFTWQKQFVFKELSARLPAGQIIGIGGCNGSGKTTLLKLISGVYFPCAGNIIVQNKKNNRSKNITLSFNAGRCFWGRLTGMQNIELFSSLNGIRVSDKFRAEVFRLAKILSMSDHLDSLAQTYSAGMCEKLEYIVNFANEKTRILLFDDFCKNIEDNTTQAILSYLRDCVHKSRYDGIIITSPKSDYLSSIAQSVYEIKNNGLQRSEN